MTQEFLQKLFDPFERSTTSTVSGIRGTGLGMDGHVAKPINIRDLLETLSEYLAGTAEI